ncbi:hypothetical protein [Mycobacterium sp. NPDC050041]|uniref:hypothetical protein n=1 Tax=Mycobacterium sp. NPDC050041 TaxID=3364293 RepID=UPI003C2C2FC4
MLSARQITDGIVEHVPSLPRAGRRFEPKGERLLDEDLKRLATRLPGASGGVIISTEFPGPRGVADLVAITQPFEDLRSRLALGLPFLTNVTDCLVVAATSPNRVRTTATVARSTGMSIERAERRLRSLASDGYLSRMGSGFVRNPGLKPIGRAYALEAKVNDWRKGLSQAVRYSSWCDAGAVVLLNSPRDLTDASSRCRRLGIGLAVRSRWVVRPKIGRPQPGFRLATSEQLAQSFSGQKPSG